MMPKSKVTAKYQVTIPKEVREKAGVRPGEIVTVEAVSEGEIRVKRTPRLKDPLRVLIGRAHPSKHVPIEKLEDLAEAG
jgi:AbrB family looped-hinge helix DNA binding protein